MAAEPARGALAGVAVHATVIWAWHVPPLYEAALSSPVLHALEHMTFLVSALLMWSLILGFGARPRPSATVILALFLTGAQGAALGGLMAFSGSPWYGAYGPGAALWSVAPLGDQQLAGMLMWGAGGLAPVIAGALLLVMWLDRLERFPRTPAPDPVGPAGPTQKRSVDTIPPASSREPRCAAVVADTPAPDAMASSTARSATSSPASPPSTERADGPIRAGS